MFTFLKNVFKKGELRQKVIFTLGILFVYRLGAAITRSEERRVGKEC